MNEVYTGEYRHGVDPKGRFIIPAKFRDELGSAFMLTKGLDGCLYLYDMDEWNGVMTKMNALSGNKKDVRNLKRFFIGGATECEPDKQGRCLLAPHLREFAHITEEITIIGVGNKIEIWDSKTLDDYNDSEDVSPEFIAESLENLDI